MTYATVKKIDLARLIVKMTFRLNDCPCPDDETWEAVLRINRQPKKNLWITYCYISETPLAF